MHTDDRFVRDHRPLQQGLRPPWKKIGGDWAHVRDHRPQQQGLRHPVILLETKCQ